VLLRLCDIAVARQSKRCRAQQQQGYRWPHPILKIAVFLIKIWKF
jgi:hypothetical protein